MSDPIHSWDNYIIATTPNGCVRGYSRNDPLIVNLARIFDYLCQKASVLYNYGHCLHLFANRSLPEMDVYFNEDSDYRQADPNGEGGYTRRTITPEEAQTLQELTRAKQRASQVLDVPEVYALPADELTRLLALAGIEGETPDQPGVLIPFDFADLNLGLFVLWGTRESPRPQQPPDDEKLRGWVGSTYFFLKHFLEREYPIGSGATYLPSFFAVRWSRAAILFAEIHNFSTMTEILRNNHSRAPGQGNHALQDILNIYYREMAQIIQRENQGRIDRFFGAGVMAIFGEHEVLPSKAACAAVSTAAKMVARFRELKPGFMQRAFGGSYEAEYNEVVDINLAIGIDYGTVFFDYLGDDRHREYTAIGDHVNFAKQLEEQASRAGANASLRPQILVSPTVYRCTRPWLRNPRRLALQLAEKSFEYTVYGLDDADFEAAMYEECQKTQDWNSPWKRIKQEPPV